MKCSSPYTGVHEWISYTGADSPQELIGLKCSLSRHKRIWLGVMPLPTLGLELVGLEVFLTLRWSTHEWISYTGADSPQELIDVKCSLSRHKRIWLGVMPLPILGLELVGLEVFLPLHWSTHEWIPYTGADSPQELIGLKCSLSRHKRIWLGVMPLPTLGLELVGLEVFLTLHWSTRVDSLHWSR